MATIITGDVLECLGKIQSGVVQCVITSPPYWGLRDYGTVEWVGGNSACSHKVGGQAEDSKWVGVITTGQRSGVDASICKICGARRKDLQIGLERTPEEYTANMVKVFREARRVLKDDGTLWLNLGDSYNGSGPSGGDGKQYTNKGSQATTTKNVKGLKPKDLVGIPWRVAFALQADGWYLRSDVIWHKPNAMPESVTDRPTRSHEYIFLLSKNRKYYYDHEAVKEPSVSGHSSGNGLKRDAWLSYRNADGSARGNEQEWSGSHKLRNRRDVWTVPVRPFRGAHFAVFPPDLIRPCVLAGAPEGGLVLDPFFGAGTTGLVAHEEQRKCLGIELSEKYAEIARNRISSSGFPVQVIKGPVSVVSRKVKGE